MEVAFSIDIGEIIDAEMAYDYFWSEIIKDKHAFRCPNDGCQALITCANIDKDRQDMKQVPNFRGYNHINGCPMKSKETIDDLQTESEFENSNVDVLSYDTFLLKRPEKLEKDENIVDCNRNGHSEAYSGSKYYSIRSLVSKWLRYRYNKSLDKTYIKVNGKELSYKTMFKGIYNQDYNDLPDIDLIYWGSAYIDRNEKIPGYRIKFQNSFNFDGEKYNPSFIISDEQIDAYPVKKLLNKRIDVIENEHHNKCFVFIFGQPELVESYGSLYVNFRVENLDYIEIRYFNLIEELKKSKNA